MKVLAMSFTSLMVCYYPLPNYFLISFKELPYPHGHVTASGLMKIWNKVFAEYEVWYLVPASSAHNLVQINESCSYVGEIIYK